MTLSYRQPGLILAKGSPDTALVTDLQRDLRRLGYLGGGIDGSFGTGTERAVKALQIDLIGPPPPPPTDGPPPFAITDFNRSPGGGQAVTQVTGAVDEALAGCIAALLEDPRAAWLPEAADPAGENRTALQAVRNAAGFPAPVPFMLAMFQQESDCRHFCVPSPRSADAFVIIGLDRNDHTNPDRVTSRGYGLGQYTLFHHPARPTEVRDFVLDAASNVRKAFAEFREKFDGWVVGPADTADDRKAEHPGLPLRLCKYAPGDARYMRDCRACAQAAPKRTIRAGTPAYVGAGVTYAPDQYYPSASYDGVPDRAAFECDWPYAARRYNGSGNDSFHYQTRILRNLLAGAGTTEG